MLSNQLLLMRCKFTSGYLEVINLTIASRKGGVTSLTSPKPLYKFWGSTGEEGRQHELRPKADLVLRMLRQMIVNQLFGDVRDQLLSVKSCGWRVGVVRQLELPLDRRQRVGQLPHLLTVQRVHLLMKPTLSFAEVGTDVVLVVDMGIFEYVAEVSITYAILDRLSVLKMGFIFPLLLCGLKSAEQIVRQSQGNYLIHVHLFLGEVLAQTKSESSTRTCIIALIYSWIHRGSPSDVFLFLM